MAELPGTDATVDIDDVRITSPGLTGTVEVHRPGSPGLRAADEATEGFQQALDRTGLLEQLTVEIRDHEEHPGPAPAGARSTDTGEPAVVVEVPEPGEGRGQVLLAADEDGVVSWRFPVDIDRAEVLTRGADRRTYIVPRTVVADPTPGQRGLLGALGRKLLKVLTFRLVDRALGEVGDFFVSRWEDKHRFHRLRPFTAATYRTDDVADLGPDDLAGMAGGRALLFVHGTLSRTHTGFARIPEQLVKDLHGRYGGRVFAFDHPTVSVSPTDNVRWLAQHLAGQLPAGAALDLDVVAHSRGGLVARVLAERPDAAGLDPDRLRVSSIVFVATPNAGTVLADRKHLGDFVDTFTNLLELVPDNPVTGVLETVICVVKQLAVGAMGGLDGLLSMDPRGDYLQAFLNRPAPGVPAAYHAVCSNFEPRGGEGLARFARDRVTDRVFGDDGNDLVVPTGGVYAANGASGFPIDEPVLFGTQAAIDHSSYWANPRTVEAFRAWLAG